MSFRAMRVTGPRVRAIPKTQTGHSLKPRSKGV